jgi:hypothetical protein
MSLRYPGGLVRKTPLTLNPALGNAANGVFKLSEAMTAVKNGTWPAYDPYFDYTTLLLHGDGTNGAQNNTFLDSSTNNFTITRNGNTTQGTFSPFSQTGWSGFFGSSDVISTSSTGIIPATGDFTIEAFVFTGSNETTLLSQGTSGSGGRSAFGITSGLLYLQIGSVATSSGSVPLNQWVHVAVTRTGSAVTFYINGSASGTATLSASVDNAVFRVGGNWAQASGLYSGYAASIRVSSVVRTITVPTSAFVNDANTRILLLQSNRFVDLSSNAYALTVSGTPSVQAFSPFAPTAAYSAATVGGSGYFDGSGDRLTIAGASAFDISSGDFTVEHWIYPLSATAQVFSQMFTATNNNYVGLTFGVSRNANGTIVTEGGSPAVGGGAPAFSITSTLTANLNAWAHIALTRNGSTFTLWINGASAGTATSANTLYWSPPNFYIGGGNDSGGSYYTGYIGGVRLVKGTAVYTSAFTPPTTPPTSISGTQVLLNFTNGGIIDNTAKNVLETVGNAQISTSVKKYGTGSLAFDGTGDYLKGVGNNPNLNFGSGNFTIEFWMYTADVTPSVAAWFVAMFNSSSGQNSWGVRLETSGALDMYLSLDGGESPTTISAASPALSNDTWHHIAVVRNGSGSNNITIYVDGVSKATGTFSSALFNSNQPVTVGIQGNTSFNQYFNGYIDDLRITKGIARYTSNFTPQTSQWQDQ